MAVESTVVPAQLYDPTNGRFNSTPIRQGWSSNDPQTFYPEEGQTYVKRVVYGTNGVYELCFMDSQGRVIQITKNGFLDTGEIAPPLVFTLSAPSNPILQSQVTGDTAFRFQVTADGSHSWGPGSGAFDVLLSRSSAGKASFTGTLGFTRSSIPATTAFPVFTSTSGDSSGALPFYFTVYNAGALVSGFTQNDIIWNLGYNVSSAGRYNTGEAGWGLSFESFATTDNTTPDVEYHLDYINAAGTYNVRPFFVSVSRSTKFITWSHIADSFTISSNLAGSLIQYSGQAQVSFSQGAINGASTVGFAMLSGLHTNIPAGSEMPFVSWDLGNTNTPTWATGALPSQRFFIINQPHIAFNGSSTCAFAATLAVAGAPLPGTNAVLTNSFSFVTQNGDVLHSLAGNIAGMWWKSATGVLQIQSSTAANYLSLQHNGTNALVNNSTGALILGVLGTNYWEVNTSGMWLAITDNANDIGAISATRPRNLFLGGTITSGGLFTSGGQITWPTGLGAITHVLGPSDQTIQIAAGSGQNLRIGSNAGASGYIVVNGLTVTTTANTSLTFNGLQNGVTIAKQASTSGNTGTLTLTNAADTALTASTEAINFNVNMSASRQWATGALATQRECLFQAPTYTAVGGSTFTSVATLAVSGAPIAGANMTFTNAYAFWVQAGLTAHGGGIVFTTDNSFNVGGSGVNRPATIWWGTQLLSPAGSASTPATSWASAGGSGWYQLTADNASSAAYSVASVPAFGIKASGFVQAYATWAFAWGSGDITTTPDVILLRENAGIMAHRNGTNAQQVNVYNTYTSGTSFERLELNWLTTANVCNIWTSKGSGGGSIRNLQFGVNATAYWAINSSGNLQPVTDNANNLGVTGTNRILNFYQTGIWQQEGANGQLFTEQQVTELTTIAAAATTDTALTVPINAVILAVSVRVVTVIPTATTFTVTATTGGTQFNTGTNVSTAAGSTDPGTKAGAFYQSAATHIRFTPNSTPATGTGQVRVTVYYYLVTPPTS